jgi:hypothetical protein
MIKLYVKTLFHLHLEVNKLVVFNCAKKLSYLPGISNMGDAEFAWTKNPSRKSAMSS